MKARAIIDLPKMPKGCYVEDEYNEYGCLLKGCLYANLKLCNLKPAIKDKSVGVRHPDCPFREVPEWTEENARVLQQMNRALENNYKAWLKWGDNDPNAAEVMQRIVVLQKLCQLAGVEVE